MPLALPLGTLVPLALPLGLRPPILASSRHLHACAGDAMDDMGHSWSANNERNKLCKDWCEELQRLDTGQREGEITGSIWAAGSHCFDDECAGCDFCEGAAHRTKAASTQGSAAVAREAAATARKEARAAKQAARGNMAAEAKAAKAKMKAGRRDQSLHREEGGDDDDGEDRMAASTSSDHVDEDAYDEARKRSIEEGGQGTVDENGEATNL